LTYPLAGNYGIDRETVESKRIQVRGLIVHETCEVPSHWGSDMTLHEYLTSQDMPAIAGVDTRALTRRLRTAGVMMGAITSDESIDAALARLRSVPRYGDTDLVREVTTDEPYEWPVPNGPQRHIVVVDSGVKFNILRLLSDRGCRLTTVPVITSSEEVLSLKPEGIVFSPGPGDPAFLDYQVATIKSLIGKAPILGDRKSTRLNSSHEWISDAVFCLKKKNTAMRNYLFKFRDDSLHQTVRIIVSMPI